MSEYVVCDSPTIKSPHHLKKALAAIGVPECNLEENEFPVPLQGYQGDNLILLQQCDTKELSPSFFA